jgi:hypothetical protein
MDGPWVTGLRRGEDVHITVFAKQVVPIDIAFLLFYLFVALRTWKRHLYTPAGKSRF